jgi:DNA repair protein RecN (Recombination protein N)
MGFLFDLHGQHSHESLLRKETHRSYLDSFSGLDAEAAAFNRIFMELAEKRKALEAIDRSEADRERRLELLGFAVDEIKKAAPGKGEIKELEAETRRLGDFEKLALHVKAAASTLIEDEVSLLSLSRQLRAELESAASIDASLSPMLKRVEDMYYEAEDLSADLRSYMERLSYDPARLEEAEERLAMLYKLKKKYRPAKTPETGSYSDEEGILAYKAEAEAELEGLSGAGESREKLKLELSRLEKDIAAKASSLSEKRREGARRLGAGITEILSRLGMPHAAFSVQVCAKTGIGLVCGPWGADDVEFMISANPGEPEKELARIASGGELSRIMLAIKTILCGAGTDSSAETLVFDEIDTGIGGEVALSVGEYLTLIGKRKQIFCVTHLASIAVRADNHLKVGKKLISAAADAKNPEINAERTVTFVSTLKTPERRKEIARMLAGESGEAALAHADELLAKYGIASFKQ